MAGGSTKIPSGITSALSLIERRADWITATARTPEKAAMLKRMAHNWLELEAASGERLLPWGAHGYLGSIAGRIRVGQGRQGAIVQVSGELAQEYGEPLAEVADHWSRVDYCVTVQDPNEQLQPDADYWSEAARASRQRGRLASLDRYQSFGGGATVTVGKRTSASYARCYNKTVESQGAYPQGCWRWEVELKRHRSEAEQLRWKSGRPDPEELLAMVADPWRRRGLSIPWQTRLSAPRRSPPGRVRDAERTYMYLSSQVGPSARFLASLVGPDVVMMALGIRDPRSEILNGG